LSLGVQTLRTVLQNVYFYEENVRLQMIDSVEIMTDLHSSAWERKN